MVVQGGPAPLNVVVGTEFRRRGGKQEWQARRKSW
jgi:hypothetical protein